MGISAAVHFTLAVVGIILLTSARAKAPTETAPFPTKFVFVASPGAGGGGGGRPEPAAPQALTDKEHNHSARKAARS